MNRRKLIFNSFKLIGILSTVKLMSLKAYAGAIKFIDKKMSKRLKYINDVNKEKAISKKYKKGDKCLNCRFYKRGKKKIKDHYSKEKSHVGTWYAKCTMATSRYVAREGHCHVYSWDKKAFPKKS